MAKAAQLSKKDLDEIKKELENKKANLESELAKFAKKNPRVKDDYEAQFKDLGTDETDNVSEVAQFSLDLNLEITLEKALRDVNKALKAIKKKNFGLCKYCKQPIALKRLKARPTSSSCVSCKTKLKSL
jgi:DnaK suppressor protein